MSKLEGFRKMKHLSPFAYFGNKRKVAPVVWDRFGLDIDLYIEPFFGSGAVLFNKPGEIPALEIINDIDGWVVNFWRAVKNCPDETADAVGQCRLYESEMHSWRYYLASNSLTPKLEGDPDFCDPRLAAKWAFLISWSLGIIGALDGPWSSKGGVYGKHGDRGVRRPIFQIVNKKRGISRFDNLEIYLKSLSDRLKNTRILSGSWTRAISDSIVGCMPPEKTAIFLDPPYDVKDRCSTYANDKNNLGEVAWARDIVGKFPNLKVALCGYDRGGIDLPGWEVYRWEANGGFSTKNSRGRENARLETIWFSPGCKNMKQTRLF